MERITTKIPRGRNHGKIVATATVSRSGRPLSGGDLTRAVDNHRDKVLRAIRSWQGTRDGYDPDAPLVTRLKTGRVIVTFPGESTELHRLRSCLPPGHLLVLRAGDPSRGRIVTPDGMTYPVALAQSSEIARTAEELRQAVRRATVLREHFTTPESMTRALKFDALAAFLFTPSQRRRFESEMWAELELAKLEQRIVTLRSTLRFLGDFTPDGDLIAARKERERDAARKRKEREAAKYGQPVTVPKNDVTTLWSWLVCYCPHYTKKAGK